MTEKLLKLKKLIFILVMLSCFGLAYSAIVPAQYVYAEESESYEHDEANGLYYKLKTSGDSSYYQVAGADDGIAELTIPASFKGLPVCIDSDVNFGLYFTKVVLNCKIYGDKTLDLTYCKNLSHFEVTSEPGMGVKILLASNVDLSVKLYNLYYSTISMENCTGHVYFEGTGQFVENSVTYPEKLTSITFARVSEIPNLSGKAYLKSVVISEGDYTCTVVPGGAFKNCTSLESVILPSSVCNIQPLAFYNCKALTEFTIPEGVTYIGDGVFACSGLKTITIPKNVESIYTDAFSGCEDLRQVVIPKTVTSISYGAFSSCSPLMTVVAAKNSVAAKYAETYGFLTTTSTDFKVVHEMKKTYVGAKRYFYLYNCMSDVTFKSSNKKVATVSKTGEITPKSPGKVTITATLENGKKYSYTYTVLKKTQKNVLSVIYSYYVTRDMSDYEKIVAADKWLVENVRYDVSKVNGGSYPDSRHTAKSAFEKGLAVCDGYANAFKIIMDHYGISCSMIYNSTHAWNQVKLGKCWYYVDVTWDDPLGEDENGKATNYNTVSTKRYLLINSEQLARDHPGPYSHGRKTTATSKSYNKQINHTGYHGAIINRTSVSIKTGKTYTLKVTGTDKKVTFISSDKSVATVNSKGKITGKSSGTCVIKVKIGERTFKIKVTIK